MKIRIGNHWYTVEIQDIDSDPAVVLVDGERFEVKLDNSSFTSEFSLTTSDVMRDPENNNNSLTQFNSPMPGTIISILVSIGEKLVVGQDIIILESMKMQQTLKSNVEGTVVDVKAREGDQISEGDLILSIR